VDNEGQRYALLNKNSLSSDNRILTWASECLRMYTPCRGLGGYLTDVDENLADRGKYFQDKDPDREHPSRASLDCTGYVGGNSEGLKQNEFPLILILISSSTSYHIQYFIFLINIFFKIIIYFGIFGIQTFIPYCLILPKSYNLVSFFIFHLYSVKPQ